MTNSHARAHGEINPTFIYASADESQGGWRFLRGEGFTVKHQAEIRTCLMWYLLLNVIHLFAKRHIHSNISSLTIWYEHWPGTSGSKSSFFAYCCLLLEHVLCRNCLKSNFDARQCRRCTTVRGWLQKDTSRALHEFILKKILRRWAQRGRR